MSDAKKAFVPNAITLITILLSSMIILMGAAAVAPALMPMKEHFGESEFLVSLVVSLPSLSVAITGFGMGILAVRLGKVAEKVVRSAYCPVLVCRKSQG